MHMLDWGPLHTRDSEPLTITLQALSLVEKAQPVQVRFTLRLRDQWSMWMQYGCIVYMDSYMASNESCFMVTWTIYKNHLLEVGLTQNQDTMALRTLTFVDLFYFIMCEDPHEIEIYWISFSHYTWESMTALHDFGGVVGRPLDTFIWALTISWSWLLAHVWSGPKLIAQFAFKMDNTNIFFGFDLHVCGVKGGGSPLENLNPSIMPRTSLI